MPETPEECEILYLHKSMRLDNDVYEREVVYMSDHQIFHRMATNGAWTAWQRLKLWDKLEDVYHVAQMKKEKGWDVTFHPTWSPGAAEFTVSVAL